MSECLGCNAVSGPAHILHSGTKVCASCPQWLIECQARYVLAVMSLPSVEAQREHMRRIEATKYGVEDAAAIRDRCRSIKAAERAQVS